MILALKFRNNASQFFCRRKVSAVVFTILILQLTANLPSLEGDTSVALDRRISCFPTAFAPHQENRCGRTCPNAKLSAIRFSSPDHSGSYGTKTARNIESLIVMQTSSEHSCQLTLDNLPSAFH